jgi:hypothetical protein
MQLRKLLTSLITCLALLGAGCVQTSAQTVLGKHPKDTVLAPFYGQNGNADATLNGLNTYSTIPLALPGGITLGGVTRTTWPTGGSSGGGTTLPIQFTSGDNGVLFRSDGTIASPGYVGLSGGIGGDVIAAPLPYGFIAGDHKADLDGDGNLLLKGGLTVENQVQASSIHLLGDANDFTLRVDQGNLVLENGNPGQGWFNMGLTPLRGDLLQTPNLNLEDQGDPLATTWNVGSSGGTLAFNYYPDGSWLTIARPTSTLTFGSPGLNQLYFYQSDQTLTLPNVFSFSPAGASFNAPVNVGGASANTITGGDMYPIQLNPDGSAQFGVNNNSYNVTIDPSGNVNMNNGDLGIHGHGFLVDAPDAGFTCFACDPVNQTWSLAGLSQNGAGFVQSFLDMNFDTGNGNLLKLHGNGSIELGHWSIAAGQNLTFSTGADDALVLPANTIANVLSVGQINIGGYMLDGASGGLGNAALTLNSLGGGGNLTLMGAVAVAGDDNQLGAPALVVDGEHTAEFLGGFYADEGMSYGMTPDGDLQANSLHISGAPDAWIDTIGDASLHSLVIDPGTGVVGGIANDGGLSGSSLLVRSGGIDRASVNSTGAVAAASFTVVNGGSTYGYIDGAGNLYGQSLNVTGGAINGGTSTLTTVKVGSGGLTANNGTITNLTASKVVVTNLIFYGSGFTGTTNATAPSNTSTVRAWVNFTNSTGGVFKMPLYQ